TKTNSFCFECIVFWQTTVTMEEKMIRVSALLDAQMDFRKIAKLIPCSLGLVSKVKKLKDEGQDLGRKPGSGGHNKKRTVEFLADLSDTIEASPTTSMRKQAKNLGVSKDTIRNAVQDLSRAKITQKWCEENLAAFWPYPDCNPLDYGIWGVMERKTCSISHASVHALKAVVEKEWAEMSVDFIGKTCKAFRPRIEAMLKANGGHFELQGYYNHTVVNILEVKAENVKLMLSDAAAYMLKCGGQLKIYILIFFM
ncbi:Uncharacterized protein FKW44_021944, partial [Caligus rogercresseyi]